MKRLSTLIYGAIILLGICSCSNEEEDIFSKSSAQRLNEAVEEYAKLLCSSENGWAMEYFANEREKGYTLLIEFRTSGGVTIAAKDNYTANNYKEDKSLFEIIADNAPVLTFNTYNTLLHYFANPEDDPDTPENEGGRGHEGDYEFVIMKASQDLIVLKGKKRGYTIMLQRLPKEQDWESYLDKLEEVKKSLFSTGIPTLYLTTANGEKYTLNNSSTGVFNAIPEGGDPISQTIKIPFIIKEDGIRTLKPFTGGKEQNEALFSIQTFTIAEGDRLICTDDGVSSITGPSGAEIFCTESTWKNGNAWKVIPEEMNGKIKEKYDATIASCMAAYNTTLDLSFKYNTNAKQSLSFLFRGKTEGSRDLQVSIDNEDLDQVHFTVGNSKDNNWNNIIKKVPELDAFIEFLASDTYAVSSNSIMKPTIVKFTSTTNANDYFTVKMNNM